MPTWCGFDSNCRGQDRERAKLIVGVDVAASLLFLVCLDLICDDMTAFLDRTQLLYNAKSCAVRSEDLLRW